MMKNGKSTRRSAVRFDTVVNGKRHCLAGSGRYGVLALNLTWVKHDPKKRPPLKTAERWCREECHLRIGAMTGGYQEAWEPLVLHEGDEITIHVLGPGRSDMPPRRSKIISPAVRTDNSEAAARCGPVPVKGKDIPPKPGAPSNGEDAAE